MFRLLNTCIRSLDVHGMQRVFLDGMRGGQEGFQSIGESCEPKRSSIALIRQQEDRSGLDTARPGSRCDSAGDFSALLVTQQRPIRATLIMADLRPLPPPSWIGCYFPPFLGAMPRMV